VRNQIIFSGAGSGGGAGRRPFHSQSSLSPQQAAADGVVLPRSAGCLEVLEVVLLAIVEARVGKNSLIMNNPDLMLRKSILTKNDAITQHK
jgi:hypothetical protein